MRKAVCGVVVAAALCASAAAEDLRLRVAFNIEPQPIGTALTDLGEQAGLQVLVRADDLEGGQRLAQPVVGELTVREALEKVLANSGLTYVFLDERTVRVRVVKRAEQQPAATEGEAQESGELAEILVTATRRIERIKDVPLSITAITADDIDRRGLVSAEDYLRGIPGVNQVDSGFAGQAIVIRGVETSPSYQNYASGSTVATYFGETPTTGSEGLSGSTNVDLRLVDIERVEVLRGPQGTAFGDSSMGGAVRTIPAAPKVDRLEAKVLGSYSVTSSTGDDNYNMQAIGNLPLIRDKVALRAVAYDYRESGFYRNRAGSNATFQSTLVIPFGAQAFARDADEAGSHRVYGGRFAALFRANDDLNFTLSYLLQRTETDGIPLAESGTYEQNLFQVSPAHIIRGERQGAIDTAVDIANAVMDYDIGWGDLIVTYSHVKGGSTQSVPFGATAGFNLPGSTKAPSHRRANTGEIRLVTRLGGPWDFLGGLYAEEVKDDVFFDYRWIGDPATNVFVPNLVELGTDFREQRLKQKAAFGEVTRRFAERWTLTVGGRAYRYDRTSRVASSGFFGAGGDGIVRPGPSGDASGSNFRGNLSYKPAETALLYAAVSQGFRLGRPQQPLTACDSNGDGVVDGTNLSVAATGQVDSDQVDSYEIGGKFTLLDRRLSIDADVFRMEWSDIPVFVTAGTLDTGCGRTYTANAGKARMQGVEFQASYRLTRDWSADIGGSWLNAELTRDAPALSPAAVDGNRLPGSPKFNANVGLQYEFEVGAHSASIRVDSIYVGSIYGDLAQSPSTESDDYVKLDASARIVIGALNADLYIKNLTDNDAVTYRGNSVFAGPFYGYHLRPRTVGVRLGYAF